VVEEYSKEEWNKLKIGRKKVMEKIKTNERVTKKEMSSNNKRK
jgi:hypothetical protein